MDPLLLLPRDHCADVFARNRWMLRIVRLAEALTLRGYPAGVSAELHMQVEDDLLPENTGAFVLTVRDGSATVARGGRGTFRLSIRALASVYTGFLSPAQLVAAGMLETSEHDAAIAAALFAGPTPWMRDHF
jgi:predicted acetyltransferase